MKYVGVWIDQKEANIIILNDDHIENKTILSEIETRERVEGETKVFGRFGDQYLNNEKGKKNKIEELTKIYLKNVLNSVKNADSILIFGPAQTKIKLGNFIQKDPKLSVKLNEIQNAEQMTDNQKIAFVKKYFQR
jgi:hypothetical protein